MGIGAPIIFRLSGNLCVGRAFSFLEVDCRTGGNDVELLGCDGSDCASGLSIIYFSRLTVLLGSSVSGLTLDLRPGSTCSIFYFFWQASFLHVGVRRVCPW